ncbi:MAG TPA: glutaredoxin family protein [Spirochaetales bacterium]|nr:glutaredoxin family protein [Spirochaetales bacterium]HRY56282.1 glutaredoxin family protein [Spirochaetia bacterium]
MLETLTYTDVEGARKERSITVYALSTCGFCKKAMAFLDARGFAYRYIYVDRIPLETKNEAKRELKERFKADIAFPFAVIDGERHLVGFIEADWAATLGS